MTVYNPPHKVTTREIPYLVLVLRHDPEFFKGKTKEPFYEFTGRRFDENTATQGPYSTVPNIR